MHTPKPSKGVAQNTFYAYYGDINHCRTCHRSEQMVEECPLITLKIYTILKQQKETHMAKIPVNKPCALYRMERDRNMDVDRPTITRHHHIKNAGHPMAKRAHLIQFQAVCNSNKDNKLSFGKFEGPRSMIAHVFMIKHSYKKSHKSKTYKNKEKKSKTNKSNKQTNSD